MSFAAAADEFVRCAVGSAGARALRLLARHPGIAHSSLYAELVLGDADAAFARLRKQPEQPRWRAVRSNGNPCCMSAVPVSRRRK